MGGEKDFASPECVVELLISDEADSNTNRSLLG